MSKQNSIPRPAGFCEPRALAGLAPDVPLCVALSGGIDSTALLLMLANDPQVCAVHVHHGIRGGEADRDADFCRALCQGLKIPLTVLQIDAPALAKSRGLGLETAARDGRYAAITAHLQSHGIPLLVTAHHADDQLETMLQHLLRGSGLRGLSGIPACRPLAPGIFVARPLLSLTHEELAAYLAQNGQSYVEDSTNREACCTRNRLRLEVAPVLRELYPKGAAAAARCAVTLQQDEAYLHEIASNFVKQNGTEPTLAALAGLPRPILARVMPLLLGMVPEQVHLEALADFCRRAIPHAALSLPGVRVTAEEGRLRILEEPLEEAFEVILQNGENRLPGGTVVYVLPHAETDTLQPYSHHRYFVKIPLCRDKIKGELRARNLRRGDKLRAGNMTRTVRKLFGSEISAATKARMPLLADDLGLVACPFGKNHNIRDDVYEKNNCDTDVYLLFD